MEKDTPGAFSYVMLTVSREQYARLYELHRQYFDQVAQISRESGPDEVLALVNLQLFHFQHSSSDDAQG